MSDPSAASRVTDDSCRELDRRAEMLEHRRNGFVRQCHGDLHLRNIVLLDGRPTLFDSVEFNDEISYGRLLRSRVSPDGSLAAKAAAPCQHRLEPLPGRDARLDSVSLLPLFLSQGGCCAKRARRQQTSARRNAAVSSRNGSRISRHGRPTAASAAACLVAVGGFGLEVDTALSLAPFVSAVPGGRTAQRRDRKRLCGVPSLRLVSLSSRV